MEAVMDAGGILLYCGLYGGLQGQLSQPKREPAIFLYQIGAVVDLFLGLDTGGFFHGHHGLVDQMAIEQTVQMDLHCSHPYAVCHHPIVFDRLYNAIGQIQPNVLSIPECHHCLSLQHHYKLSYLLLDDIDHLCLLLPEGDKGGTEQGGVPGKFIAEVEDQGARVPVASPFSFQHAERYQQFDPKR
jgi:hypothetical protein